MNLTELDKLQQEESRLWDIYISTKPDHRGYRSRHLEWRDAQYKVIDATHQIYLDNLREQARKEQFEYELIKITVEVIWLPGMVTKIKLLDHSINVMMDSFVLL